MTRPVPGTPGFVDAGGVAMWGPRICTPSEHPEIGEPTSVDVNSWYISLMPRTLLTRPRPAPRRERNSLWKTGTFLSCRGSP